MAGDVVVLLHMGSIITPPVSFLSIFLRLLHFLFIHSFFAFVSFRMLLQIHIRRLLLCLLSVWVAGHSLSFIILRYC